LSGFEVVTVQQQGWSALSNGQLLRSAEIAGFGAYLQHQQNLSNFNIRIIVLELPSNRFAHVRLLAPQILSALGEMQPGELRVVK